MTRTKAKLTLLALGMLLLPACRTAPLLKPAPFKAAATPEKTKRAIEVALTNRGWLISKEEPGKIHANITVRGTVAQILISYGDTVKIDYVDSQNLRYGMDNNGRTVINRHYNAWIQRLVSDINRNIMLGE